MKVAAIVPAYNEELTIGEVVRTLRSSERFVDVIVISDGSSDQTALRAREAGATIVRELPERQGKGSAMQEGIRHTDAPFIFFADADLRGLTVEHVRTLLDPVTKGALAMAVGLRDRGRFLTPLQHFLPLISGERALRREVIEHIPPKLLQGYQVELAMNYHCRLRGWRYRGIALKGLFIRRKTEKVGFFRSVPQYLSMGGQILSGAFRLRAARLRGELEK